MIALALLLLAAEPAPPPAAPPAPAAQPAPEAPADEARRFADWLFRNGDYYRAIGEYERYLFLAPQGPDRDLVTLQIARAYARGGKVDEAVGLLDGVERTATTPALHDAAVFEQGYARYRAAMWAKAEYHLLRYADGAPVAGPGAARARLLAGLAELHLGDARAARASFEEAGAADGRFAAAAKELTAAAQEVADAPSRSPGLAGVLSAIVPGLGHVYVGQPVVGLGAFLWNAGFVYATVDLARRRLWGPAVGFGLVESIWYGGAILGAVNGAERYNRDARDLAVERAEKRFRWVVDLEPLPGGAAAGVGAAY